MECNFSIGSYRFEPRRIVLKEGHVASGFYIVLSGTCLVNQKETDPRNGETFVRTITQLTSGESFGVSITFHPFCSFEGCDDGGFDIRP